MECCISSSRNSSSSCNCSSSCGKHMYLSLEDVLAVARRNDHRVVFEYCKEKRGNI